MITYGLAGVMVSPLVLIEKVPRYKELTLFCLPKVLHSLWNMMMDSQSTRPAWDMIIWIPLMGTFAKTMASDPKAIGGPLGYAFKAMYS